MDRNLLRILRDQARTPITELARRVGLSTAPVSRRLARLERHGIIRGYTAIIDEGRTGQIEAFTEVHLSPGEETSALESIVWDVPEVHEFMVIAGDTDALVHFRVEDVEHLQRVVNELRRSGPVADTRTHIVLHRASRPSQALHAEVV